MNLQSVCVFCGSSPGFRPEYAAAAENLGICLAKRNIRMVFGGGRVGLMGIVADAVLSASGNVTGVIPQALVDRELAHRGVTDLRVVSSMHERKFLMADLSEGFIALPGGFGTFEEMFEVITWSQLGLHRKPCGFLNVAGFFDPLLSFIQHAVMEGFIRKEHADMVFASSSPEELLSSYEQFSPPSVQKWIRPGEE